MFFNKLSVESLTWYSDMIMRHSMPLLVITQGRSHCWNWKSRHIPPSLHWRVMKVKVHTEYMSTHTKSHLSSTQLLFSHSESDSTVSILLYINRTMIPKYADVTPVNNRWPTVLHMTLLWKTNWFQYQFFFICLTVELFWTFCVNMLNMSILVVLLSQGSKP